MTKHYHIDLTNGLRLKLTFRGGRFHRVERVRGKMPDGYLKAIGHLLPPREEAVSAFAKALQGKATFTAIQKKKTLFTEFNDAWHAFYEREMDMPPKFSGVEGKALKSIIAYLKKATGSDADALVLWRALLDNWQHLDEFHRKNPDLKYINSNLNRILTNIKRINNNASGVSASYLERIMQDLQSG